MAKTNFFDNPHIRFHFEKNIDFESLFNWLSPADRETMGVNSAETYQKLCVNLLESMGEIIGSEIAPRAADVEKETVRLNADGTVEHSPTVAANVARLISAGCSGISIRPRYGGLGVPFLVEYGATELLTRACPSTLLTMSWYGTIAAVLEEYASEEIKDEYLPKIARGEVGGCMALTEADAGSDLSSIRTYGERQPDGSWKLYGSKRFISNGYAEICLVLAKNAKGADGLDALNMFLVTREHKGAANVRVTRVEEKLGLHGAATCDLLFDGAHAVMIGRNGEGFRNMLKLMNEARLGVAFQGVGILEAVLRNTEVYAKTRKTWGKPLIEHELIAEKIADMQTDLFALRSLCMHGANAQAISVAGERYMRENPDLPEAQRDAVARRVWRAQKRLREWTPLLKYWAGEKSFLHARNGLQIHGGYGFTKEYRAEWLLRESTIISIYEGTSQIQALMCVKDTLKTAIRKPHRFLNLALGRTFRRLAEADPLKRKWARANRLYKSAVLALLAKILKANVKQTLSQTKPGDILKMLGSLKSELVRFQKWDAALLHAERICEMKSIVLMGKALIEDQEIDSTRRAIAERFLSRYMPRLVLLKTEIKNEDRWMAKIE